MVYSSRRLCGESDVRCGGPRSTPLRLRESQTTLDAPVERNVSRGLSSPSRLCERPCQVGDDLVQ